MRRAAGLVVGIVLIVTAGEARAQRRIRFESLGTFELLRHAFHEDGKASLNVGGAIGSTRGGDGAKEALAGARYGASDGGDFIALDARLAATSVEGEAVILDGSHRARARTGNLRLDLAVDHSSIGRSFSLRADVAPEPYRDVSVGGGVGVMLKPLPDGGVVAPFVVRGRRVSYAGERPGFTSIEASAGVGARFIGRDEDKKGTGSVEMLKVAYTGTRFDQTADMHYAPPVLHQIDVTMLDYDELLFSDKDFAFSMYIRMGYGHVENETTGEDGGAPIFRYGAQMEGPTGGLGLIYSVGPGHDDEGEIISLWRVEMLARGKRPSVGGWDLRFAWTCATPDATDDVCGADAVGRAAVELEGYLDVTGGLQLGGSYLGDYGPWRGTSEWRNEALAFLRWVTSPS